MSPRELPVVGRLSDVGPEDPVFDSLLLVGPFVVVLIAMFGRHPVSDVVAVGYLVTFFGYVSYRGFASD